jgi:hypothetical protein
VTYQVTERNTNEPWVNYAVHVAGDRRTYWVGWNGQRINKSSEIDTLLARHPSVLADLVGWFEADRP